MPSFNIIAYGHENITATHESTFQLTKEDHLTKSGSCIIGINASESTQSLPSWLKTNLKKGNPISITLKVDDNLIEGIAFGHKELTLNDPIDIVFRKSRFISDRTIAINCNITANDIPKEIIQKLRDPKTQLKLMLTTK